MAEEGLQIVELQDAFYRDSFGKVMILIVSMLVAITLLAGLSFYLYRSKPKPVTFLVYPEWRVVGPVAEDQAYLTVPELLQWVSDALRNVFVFNFNDYNKQLDSYKRYFTSDGWNVYLNHLNNYANYSKMMTEKTFINATPASAPIVLNQGLLSGRYGWWVQMPLELNTIGLKGSNTEILKLQVLVVRIPTAINLQGVAIENIMVLNGPGGT